MHTGILVIKGNGDLSDVWKPFASEVPKSIVIGNARNGENEFLESSGVTTPEEVLFEVHKRVPKVEDYRYMIFGQTPASILNIPNRSSSIGMWLEGDAFSEDRFQDPIKLLVRLNYSEDNGFNTERRNYTELVADRVMRRLPAPRWAMTLLYAGVKPSFILSSKRMDLHMWVMFYNGVYFLLWSTRTDAVKYIESTLDGIQANHLLAIPLEFGTNKLVTLHPLYLVSKFHNNTRKYQDSGDRRLLSCRYLQNYVNRIIHEVDYDDNSQDQGS